MGQGSGPDGFRRIDPDRGRFQAHARPRYRDGGIWARRRQHPFAERKVRPEELSQGHSLVGADSRRFRGGAQRIAAPWLGESDLLSQMNSGAPTAPQPAWTMTITMRSPSATLPKWRLNSQSSWSPESSELPRDWFANSVRTGSRRQGLEVMLYCSMAPRDIARS